MADLNAPGSPDAPDPPDNLMDIISRYQNLVAWFTMQPGNYDDYCEIEHEFLLRAIPYDEFRHRMGVLLDPQRAPQHGHLRVFLDVYHRAFTGEELEIDNILCLFPVELSMLLNSFYSSNDFANTFRNSEPHPGQARRTYNLPFNMPLGDAVRAPGTDLDPNVLNTYLHNWCQENTTQTLMRPEEFQAYISFSQELRRGRVSYDDAFRSETPAPLFHPAFQALRGWWTLHRLEVLGVMRMLNNPVLRYPLDLYISLSLVVFCTTMKDIKLWTTCLNNVRRREDDGV